MYMRTRKHIRRNYKKKYKQRKTKRLMKGGTNWCNRYNLPLYISSIHGESFTAPFFGRPIGDIIRSDSPLFTGINRISPP